MKNIMMKDIKDDELIAKTKALVAEERLKTLQVIEHLQEIYDRRLHLACGYPSIHEFLVKELSYSDGAAHRRIAAMRLVGELPETKDSIASGKLSLSTASLVQGFFQLEKKSRHKSYSKEEKLELISNIEGRSKSECERELAKASPAYRETLPTITRDRELEELIEEFRKLAMIADGRPQNILKEALKIAIDQKKKRSAKVLGDSGKRAAGSIPKTAASPEKLEAHERLAAHENEVRQSRYISVTDKERVWQSAQGCCTYRDHRTGRRCASKKYLQLDHVKPYALDGKTTAANLRLLCRAHNLHYARQTFGSRLPGAQA